ncbi:CapA family protein [Candidatus Uhrbacteria bacterium]|nr:CapA family protein [Candidatus Uhrbacteria bacterium]
MVYRRALAALVAVPVLSVVISGVGIVAAFRILASAGASVSDGPGAATNSFPVSPPRNAPVTVFVVGDVMLDRTVATRIRKANDALYPFRRIMEEPLFRSAHARLMNLEGPVTAVRRAPEKSIDFAFAPESVSSLRAAGFDAASQANNHAWDQGRIGAAESRDRLRQSGIVAFGDEVEEGAVSLAIMRLNGRSVALVGFNTVTGAFDETGAMKAMDAARAADLVLAFMHWGEEYRDRPTPDQQKRAMWLIDHGADAVIGAHPHWTQGVGLYRGKPILYSLGNFVFDQDWSEETREGLAALLTFSDRDVAIDLLPVRIDQSQPRLLEGASRDARLRRLSSLSDPSLTNQILNGKIILPVN